MQDELRFASEFDETQPRLECRTLRLANSNGFSFHGLIYASSQMAAVLTAIRRVAVVDETVILLGETGTGKELLARAIHQESNRRKGPFVPFNCSVLTRELVESRLFGYRRGAFTGAATNEPGVIRAAAGGTLFLDEIGDLTLEAQGVLLRFLETREVQPVGESSPARVDVRVVAATNLDLQKESDKGRFRKDLFYRLCVAPIHIPPLRKRRDDIAVLARHLAHLHSRRNNLPELLFASGELEQLCEHSWPGNVRELENYVKRRLLFGNIDLVAHDQTESNQSAAWLALSTEARRDRVLESLRENNGNITLCAKHLGISRRTVQRMMRRGSQQS